MVQAFGAVSTWTVLSVFIKSPEDTGFCLWYKSGMIKLSRRLRYILSLLHLAEAWLAMSAFEHRSSATSGMAVAATHPPFGWHLCLLGSS